MRYIEIMEVRDGIPTLMVEYFGDFALWSYKNAVMARAKPDKNPQIMFIADFLLTEEEADEAWKLMQQGIPSETVDLAEASNPLSKRRPAMKKKGRK